MLHEDHPDYNCQPGDKREVDGVVWTFGKNQYSAFWRARPKDGTVICSKDYGYEGWDSPYRSGGVYAKEFDDAARRAQRSARKEYERALEIVRRYES